MLKVLKVVSLALLAAVGAVWVRSHVAQDSFDWERVEQRGDYRVVSKYVVHTYRGGCEVAGSVYGEGRGEERAASAALAPGPLAWVSGPPRPSFHFPRRPMTVANRLGFLVDNDGVRRDALRDTFRGGWMVAVPFWIVALAAGVLPGADLLGRLRRRGRSRAGLCPGCGYDLRATPGRCPECGKTGTAT